MPDVFSCRNYENSKSVKPQTATLTPRNPWADLTSSYFKTIHLSHPIKRTPGPEVPNWYIGKVAHSVKALRMSYETLQGDLMSQHPSYWDPRADLEASDVIARELF